MAYSPGRPKKAGDLVFAVLEGGGDVRSVCFSAVSLDRVKNKSANLIPENRKRHTAENFGEVPVASTPDGLRGAETRRSASWLLFSVGPQGPLDKFHLGPGLECGSTEPAKHGLAASEAQSGPQAQLGPTDVSLSQPF